MVYAGPLRPHIIRAETRVHQDIVDELHIPRVHALIAGGDGFCLPFAETRFECEPHSQPVMDVAFKCERRRRREQQTCKNERPGRIHGSHAMVPDASFKPRLMALTGAFMIAGEGDHPFGSLGDAWPIRKFSFERF